MTTDGPLTGPGLGHAPEAPLPLAPRREQDAFLREAFQHHSKTFSFAARLLPKRVRLPVATVYLYCRTVDHLADERAYEIGREAARREADTMRQNLGATLAGAPPEAGANALLWRRLAEVHREFGLDAHPLHQQLEGAVWDLDETPVQTNQDLLDYSDLVAGSVGAIVLPFLVREGTDRDALDRPARALGAAMQFTNILRDVGEDIRELGRVYLPADQIAEAGITPEALLRAASGAEGTGMASLGPLEPRYAALVESLMQQAEAFYDEADRGIANLRFSAKWGIRTALRTYREILNEVRARGYDNLTQRAWVPKRRKVRLAVAPGYTWRRQKLAG